MSIRKGGRIRNKTVSNQGTSTTRKSGNVKNQKITDLGKQISTDNPAYKPVYNNIKDLYPFRVIVRISGELEYLQSIGEENPDDVFKVTESIVDLVKMFELGPKTKVILNIVDLVLEGIINREEIIKCLGKIKGGEDVIGEIFKIWKIHD
jgi:hypothetical protein